MEIETTQQALNICHQASNYLNEPHEQDSKTSFDRLSNKSDSAEDDAGWEINAMRAETKNHLVTTTGEIQSHLDEKNGQAEVHSQKHLDGLDTNAANSKSEKGKNNANKPQTIISESKAPALVASNISAGTGCLQCIGTMSEESVRYFFRFMMDKNQTVEAPSDLNHDELNCQQLEQITREVQEESFDYRTGIQDVIMEGTERDPTEISYAHSTRFGLDYASEIARNSTQATSVGSIPRRESKEILHLHDFKDLDELIKGPTSSNDPEDDDLASISTDNQELTLPSHIKAQYIVKFAEEIYANLGLKVSEDEAERLSCRLPGYLKLFTLEFTRTIRLGVEKDAVIFVRHQRR
jgi:hypothetical protein